MSSPLVTRPVAGTVPAVLERVREELDRRKITVFTVIDHAAGARQANLELADEVVVIFGNAVVGTALMQADPGVGIELPLRLLIFDDSGTTRVSYRDPTTLAVDYRLATASDTLDRLGNLLASLVTGLADHAAD